jgi:antitoxin CcdA
MGIINAYNIGMTTRSVTAPYPLFTTLKKPINLTLSSEVLEEAKLLGINISKACDAFLTDLVKKEKTRRWQAEHAEFISAYNKTIEKEGLPLDEWRTF